MPRKTVNLASGPSSDDDKISRPSADKLAAEEEIRADEKDLEKDVPPAGENKPGNLQDKRKRCAHGRLFQCRQCDPAKRELSEEEKAKRREKLENTVGQVYNALFNLAAIISGEESLRLTKEERHGLETTGASALEETVPAVSFPILTAIGHAATLTGLVAGKLIDIPKEQDKKKAQEVNKLLDKGKNGVHDAEHAPADRGPEKIGENDAGPSFPRIKVP